MADVVLATTAIHSDDAAYSLKELDEPAPDSRGFHRYRILKVVPGGRLQAGMLVVSPEQLREWRFDMGLSVFYPDDPIAIIGGVPRPDGAVEILETVGRLTEMAERMHAGYVEPVERPEPSDLIGNFHDQNDQLHRLHKATSIFGYGQALQRS
ncbi:MAG: hypothetical protein Q7O66_17455 [Dehalococcoidia bacterium]|nr:hypothetical protein [Dehalococcoidia bacterium]